MYSICLLSYELISWSPALEFILQITTKFYRTVFEVYLNFTLRETFSGTTFHVPVQRNVVHKRVTIWISLLGCFVNSRAYDLSHSCGNTCYTCSISQFHRLTHFWIPIYYLSSAAFILTVQLTDRRDKPGITWEISAQISAQRPVFPKSFIISLSPSRQLPGWSLKLAYERFFLHHLQFITH
jgi:hypothetical protein